MRTVLRLVVVGSQVGKSMFEMQSFNVVDKGDPCHRFFLLSSSTDIFTELLLFLLLEEFMLVTV